MACRGRGTERCRKEVFVRICPGCKFVKTVPCSTCRGSGKVTRRTLEWLKERSRPDKKTPSKKTTGSEASPKDTKSPKDAEDTDPTQEPVEMMYLRLAQTFEQV